jgi:hypothetical protein
LPNLLTPFPGMRQTPMAYSPQTGYIYALGNSSLQWLRRAEDPYVFILGGARVPGNFLGLLGSTFAHDALLPGTWWVVGEEIVGLVVGWFLVGVYDLYLPEPRREFLQTGRLTGSS